MITTSNTGATLSPCGLYRYALWRVWDNTKAPMLFIMLNPSTADAFKNDPTVERCERRARFMGFGSLWVVNLFALRSTNPALLYGHSDPIGPDNDSTILDLIKSAGMVVCGWGKHGDLLGRDLAVISLLRSAGVVPYYLGQNRNGSPKHPLYVGYAVAPMEWSMG
ncbi:DUF1643 domain-containing protein [Methylobacillus caricis]|uniref:DUF1643 domain-containing protein n=1 Tax=Methylobacillus caricis TaxID=1971611 RepID=UPI001CFF6FC8|nr:DUF1643 domain-containing protein [Methylobacillus caricis]MCB5187402.1 DUF1643 domain-containing protein [Methylobacillus caricis]